MNNIKRLELQPGNLEIYLEKDGETHAIYKGEDDLSLATKITFVVKKPNIHHKIVIKAVLRGRAKFDFEGVLLVEKGATNSDTYLDIKCLMLSNEAVATIIPSLEIKEDAVKSGHGATVGSIDVDQLHYLKSRGLSKKVAEDLIVEGFLNLI